jgi:hypothetical protein
VRAITGSITLDAVTYPRTYLPLVQRYSGEQNA